MRGDFNIREGTRLGPQSADGGRRIPEVCRSRATFAIIQRPKRSYPRRNRRMPPSCTASAMASASRKLFFWPLEYARTYLAGISRALCPPIFNRLR